MNEKIITERQCKACGFNSDLHEHHIIPQFMKSKNNKKINLCNKHHNVIHNYLNKVIWKNTFLGQEGLEDKIASFTNWFCKLEWDKWNPQDKRDFLSNNCILCHEPTRFNWWDYDIKIGLFGLCAKCAKWEQNSYKNKSYAKKEEENANTN